MFPFDPPPPQRPAPERYGRLDVRTDGLGPAHWLTGRSPSDAWMGRVAGVVAPGFAAYARILHPAALDDRPVRWSTVAAAHGRTVAPDTRWHELFGVERPPEEGLPGVREYSPDEGPTPPAVAELLIPILARHTETPERCWFGLWDGYGRYDFPDIPTFETPGRDKVLLSGPLAEAVSPASTHQFDQLPDLWWPEDRAWCLGGDVDLCGTYVGGSPALIAELSAAPDLEAFAVESDGPLG